jgi:hypothetical protein
MAVRKTISGGRKQGLSAMEVEQVDETEEDDKAQAVRRIW